MTLHRARPLAGREKSIEEARAAHAAAWVTWLEWAGLEQKDPVRWSSG
jgi:hypothetical protein